MRSHWLLLPLFGALVGSVGADLPKRQNDNGDDTTTSAGGSEPSTTEGSGGSEPPQTTTQPPPDTTTGGGGGGGGDTSDTTVTVTTTVGGGEGSTETTRTTVSVTSPSTAIITTTEYETTTVTEQNGDGTATRTVYETTTVTPNNERRAVENIPRTIAEAQAVPTADAPAPTAADAYIEMIKRDPAPAHLAKRDTITVTETETRSGGGDETVTDTITRTAFDVTTRRTTVTNTMTETDEVGATTTETVTSTLTETSSQVSTGITEPTDDGSSGGDGDDNGGGGGGGLSTGAKAGIGAGVGVAGLVILAGLGWFCFKKRRGGPKPDHDDMFGASEVPVGAAAAGGAGGAAAGAAAGRRTPPMSHSLSTSTGGGLAPSAASKQHAPEGYRGTAMGDGRAGYAKPEPYGAAYTRASGITRSPGSSNMTGGYSRPTDPSSTMVSNGNDSLPEHSTPAEMESVSSPQTAELGAGGTASRWENPNAAEIDGQPALNTQSGPVYEMPSQPYR